MHNPKTPPGYMTYYATVRGATYRHSRAYQQACVSNSGLKIVLSVGVQNTGAGGPQVLVTAAVVYPKCPSHKVVKRSMDKFDDRTSWREDQHHLTFRSFMLRGTRSACI